MPLRRDSISRAELYLALEVDDSKQAIPADKKADAIERALKTVRSRIEGSGVSEAVVQKQGNDRIVVQIPGDQDPERASKLVEEQAFLEFKITDKTQALERALPKLDQVVKQRGSSPQRRHVGQDAARRRTRDLQGLLQGSGHVQEERFGQESAPAQGRAKKDSRERRFAQAAGRAARSRACSSRATCPASSTSRPNKVPTLETLSRRLGGPGRAAAGQGVHSGHGFDVAAGQVVSRVLPRRPQADHHRRLSRRTRGRTRSPTDGTIVEFELDNEGGRRFRNETGKHIGDYMAIMLDDRVMGRPPVIQGAIGTRGQITMGGKALADAQDLALVLRAGALPVPLRVAEAHEHRPEPRPGFDRQGHARRRSSRSRSSS